MLVKRILAILLVILTFNTVFAQTEEEINGWLQQGVAAAEQQNYQEAIRLLEQAKDGYVFAEVEELEKIKHDGVKVKEDGGKTIIDVDFEKYPELKDDEVLKDYAYFSSAEISFLQNEKGFSCISDSESKMEVVYIDTGKKVE